MEFPTIDKFAKEVAEKALDEITYEGKTIREWAELLVKQQPCEDAVSREEVQDLISRWLSDYLLDETREALETINYKVGDMPSVIPERPKGKWIDGYCSECGKSCLCDGWGDDVESKFCPNCGAEMSGGREDEDRKSL